MKYLANERKGTGTASTTLHTLDAARKTKPCRCDCCLLDHSRLDWTGLDWTGLDWTGKRTLANAVVGG